MLQIVVGLLRGAEVWLGNDLDEGNAGAVEVDVRPAARRVDRLASVVLQVNAVDAEGLVDAVDDLPGWLTPSRPNLNSAAPGQRLIVLGDLVALGQVRVKIVLAGKKRSAVD